jgi:NADH-quinone oxidoreductase chain I
MGWMKETFNGFKNLLIGLKTTGRYLSTRAVTLQYPDERWPMPERSRGVVVLLSDPETGELNCNACLVCMRQCPVSAITTTQAKNDKGERYPETFEIDNTLCCFCGICEEVCNFDAIKLTGKYEFSVFNKEDLIYNKARLQEIGRDVKYEPKKKAKPAAKPASRPADGSPQAEAQPAAEIVAPKSEAAAPATEKPEKTNEGGEEKG